MSNLQRPSNSSPDTSSANDNASEPVYRGLEEVSRIYHEQPSPIRALEDKYAEMWSEPRLANFKSLGDEIFTGIRDMNDVIDRGGFVNKDEEIVSCLGKTFKSGHWQDANTFYFWCVREIKGDLARLHSRTVSLLKTRANQST